MQKALIGLAVAVLLANLPGVAGATVSLCEACIECPDGVSACFEDAPNASAECVRLGCLTAVAVRSPCSEVAACPTTEAGQCNDGVDNDVNGLTDSEDPACAVGTPILDPRALGALAAVLALGGTWSLARRRRAR